MTTSSVRKTPERAVASCLLLWALVAGCGREAPGTSQPVSKTLAQQLADQDETVWRDELTARHYEDAFIQLADRLRRAENKTKVMGDFPFDQITIPLRSGDPETLDLDVRRQHFAQSNPVVLAHAGWQKALAQFGKAGWNLVQFEWQHEKFYAARRAFPARSEFSFELHGEQAVLTNRFIIRGTLDVEWKPSATTNQPAQVKQLTVSRLTLLERTGPPAFSNHLLIAPDPATRDAQVNVHPLIVLDLNGDRHDDIVLPGVNKALLNDGKANFETMPFIREELFYGLKEAGVIADFNGDGKLDYLGVPEMGPLMKMLALYPGNGSLPQSIAPVAAWNLQRTAFNQYKFDAASVLTTGDIDGDGDLDVYVAQYRPPYINGNLPTPYYDANDGYPSFLLVNDGRGNFEQAKNKMAFRGKDRRRTLAASFVDIDSDGDMDLVTLNDFSGADLFLNDGKGSFTDETARLGNRQLFGMGHAFADFNHDGALDFLAIGMSIPTVRRLESMNLGRLDFPDHTRKRSDMTFGNRLWLHREGQWIQPPWAKQIAHAGWAWGTSAFDLDNDGDLEIYVANGHVSGSSSADYDSLYWTRDIYIGSSRADAALQEYFNTALLGLNSGRTSWNGHQHNALFFDAGTHSYINAAFLFGVAHESDCRAVVSADLNADGRPDLLVTEAQWQGSPNKMRHRLLVHLNTTSTSNHWIGVRFDSVRSAIGAKVFVTTDRETRVAQVVTGDSFQSQHPPALHFGLGKSHLSEVRVVWPNGKVQKLENPIVDRWHVVRP